MRTNIFILSVSGLTVCLLLSGIGCDREHRDPSGVEDEQLPSQPLSASQATDATCSNYIVTVAWPFYRRYWVTPFLASPEAQRPWAKDALRLLEEDAFGSAASWVNGLADIRSETPALIDQGCTYPIIRWMFAQHLAQEGKSQEALAVLNAMAKEMEDQPSWPSLWQTLVRTSIRNQTEYKPQIEGAAADAFFATLADGTFASNETRVAWNFLCSCSMDSSTGLAHLLQTDKARGIDPWFVHMLKGTHAYNRAWRARGVGYADSVTSEGWNGYRAFIVQSRELFEQAWWMHPDIPETACNLIRVSQGDAQACRLWFDRALNSELDHSDAYQTYLFTLRPRWCGSLDQMEELADEAYSIGRFDTAAPVQCVFAYFAIADELREDWQQIFRKAGVYAKCSNALERHIQRTFNSNRGSRNYFNMALAYAAYGAGDYDTAARAVSRLERPPTDHMAFYDVRPPPPFNYVALSAIKGLNGPNKTLMRQIHLTASESPPQQGLAAISDIPCFRALSAPEADLLGYWEIELHKRLAVTTNERMDLMPTHGSLHCQGPWINYQDAWVYKQHTLHTTSEMCRLGTTVLLPCDGTFDVTLTTDQYTNAGTHFALALDSRLGTNGEQQSPALCLLRGPGEWCAFWGSRQGLDSKDFKALSDTRVFPDPSPRPIQVSIRSNKNRVSATVNGQTLFEDLDLSTSFHDKFRSGRLPFLFGGNVVITQWTFTPL